MTAAKSPANAPSRDGAFALSILCSKWASASDASLQGSSEPRALPGRGPLARGRWTAGRGPGIARERRDDRDLVRIAHVTLDGVMAEANSLRCLSRMVSARDRGSVAVAKRSYATFQQR
jgi:hypothetical protein